MTSDLERLTIAFLAGVRTAAGCWTEGEGEATTPRTAQDYERLLSSLTRYCYTDHIDTLPPYCQSVIPDLCAILAAKIKTTDSNTNPQHESETPQ